MDARSLEKHLQFFSFIYLNKTQMMGRGARHHGNVLNFHSTTVTFYLLISSDLHCLLKLFLLITLM